MRIRNRFGPTFVGVNALKIFDQPEEQTAPTIN